MEHRDNHSEFKRIIANLVTVFVNGRKELGERLKEVRRIKFIYLFLHPYNYIYLSYHVYP